MPSVAIVEDHLLVAQTLRAALLESAVAAEVYPLATPDVLLAALLSRRPDLVLLDLDLGPYGDGTTLIRPLHDAHVRVLVVSGLDDRERTARAYEEGAFGYQSKAAGFDALLAKVHAALHSDAPLDPIERTELLLELRRRRQQRDHELAAFHSLTQREQDTLIALSEGRSVADIAADWVVSEATVRTHVRGVLTKLDVPNQHAAVGRALRSRWITGSRP